MKMLLLALLSMIFLAFGNHTHAQEAKVKKDPDKTKAKTNVTGNEVKMKKEDDKIVLKGQGVGKDMVYPYTAGYSYQFVPGSPANARTVLEIWKAWESNTLDQKADALADTVLWELPNGDLISGKDRVLSALKQQRDSLATSQVSMEAWMPFKSIDRNEEWVGVWATEQATDKAGKTTTTRYHEIWGVNKDGKVAYIRQYTAGQPKY